MNNTHTSTKNLNRILGRKELLSIAIGQTIGSGIFALTGIAIGITGKSVVISMFVAAIFTLLMTIPMIFVSGSIRMRGGFYTQLALLTHERWAGFFVIIHIIAWSALSMYAISFSDYLLALVPGLNPKLMATLLLTTIYVINLLGMKSAAKLQSLMTLVLAIAIALFSVVGMTKITPGFFRGPNFAPAGLRGILSAGALLTWAMGGSNVVIHLGAEAKNPTKDIPYAIIGGTLLVAVFYAFMSTVAAGVLPVDMVANQPLTLVANHIFSKPLYVFFIVGGAMFALITTLNSCFGWVTKPILQASIDGWLPKNLSKLNRYHAPYIILTLLFIESLIPIVLGINLSSIANMTVILNNLVFALICYSSINMRTRIPELWNKSRYKVPDLVLVAFSIIGSISTLAQIGLLIPVLSRFEILANGGVAILALLYSHYRLKSGKVNMEVSYESV